MCHEDHYDYVQQNELTDLEGELHAALREMCEKLNAEFSVRIRSGFKIEVKLRKPLDEAKKSDWAQRIVRNGFDLTRNMIDVRHMNDEQIADMIPMYRGAICIVRVLLKNI